MERISIDAETLLQMIADRERLRILERYLDAFCDRYIDKEILKAIIFTGKGAENVRTDGNT